MAARYTSIEKIYTKIKISSGSDHNLIKIFSELLRLGALYIEKGRKETQIICGPLKIYIDLNLIKIWCKFEQNLIKMSSVYDHNLIKKLCKLDQNLIRIYRR